ncbi:hypothetical protein DPMN_147423 [Dreissena polymorpha]|uniref:Uncharacterized protein n=1 Tax=Dreissena polymorpha TaxID=45954 RepID=A0A9D4F8B6_DREPO|nr:hypothetical protein DPMN_147423 [Dreissena polymorpha]
MATVRQYDGDNAIERWRHCDDTTAKVRYDYRIVAPGGGSYEAGRRKVKKGIFTRSLCLCSIEEKWLYDEIEELNLGGDANFAGFPDVLQLMEGCSCFNDAGLTSTSVSPWLSKMLPR